MKKYRLTIIILFTLNFAITSQLDAQIIDWANSITGNVFIRTIAADNSGNSYITGGFYGSATFGNNKLTASLGGDFFIAKYDASGNCVWAKQSSCTSGSNALSSSISVDSSGISYTAGEFSGSETFGNINLTATNPQSIFITRYDSNGNCIWAKQAGNNIIVNGISFDGNGNCYITGNFRDTAEFGAINLITTNTGSAYIAKYDTNGNCIWAKQNSGSTNSWAEGFGAATESDGSTIITGQFNGDISFGNFQLTAPANTDLYNIFITKYDSSGNCLWAKQSSGTGYFDNALGISLDTNGNSFITGQFSQLISFDNIQMTSSGSRSTFIAKYDFNGNCIWAKEPDGGYTYSNGIATDIKGESYITGQFFGQVKFGTTLLNSGDSANFFIAKYDANGNNIWAEQSAIVDSNTIARGLGIAADNNGNCYVTGAFNGIISFGNKIIAGNGFVAKISNTITGIITKKTDIPDNFKLDQNYPNPFNPTTTISFAISHQSFVTLKVYDMLGREVATLLNQEKPAGKYSVEFNASNETGLSSGIYFYRIEAGSYAAMKKMVLIK